MRRQAANSVRRRPASPPPQRWEGSGGGRAERSRARHYPLPQPSPHASRGGGSTPAFAVEDGDRNASIDLAKTPSFRLDGKRALVTGGGRGIGLDRSIGAGRGWRACDARGAHQGRDRGGRRRDPRARRQGRRTGARRHRHRRRAQGAGGAPSPIKFWSTTPARNRPTYAARRHGRGLRRHHGAQRARGVLRGAGGGAAPDRGQAPRLDHQHLLADGPCRRRAPHRLLRQQARHGGLHQGDGDRAGARTTSASTAWGRRSSRRR